METLRGSHGNVNAAARRVQSEERRPSSVVPPIPWPSPRSSLSPSKVLLILRGTRPRPLFPHSVACVHLSALVLYFPKRASITTATLCPLHRPYHRRSARWNEPKTVPRRRHVAYPPPAPLDLCYPLRELNIPLTILSLNPKP
jgi:hypothetical protein